MIFSKKKKNEIIINEGDIVIDGKLWTDFELLSASLLDPNGSVIHVSGDIILYSKESDMPNIEGNIWMSCKDLPPIRDMIAYSKIFSNNRYNLKDKRYEGRAIKDLRVFKSKIS